MGEAIVNCGLGDFAVACFVSGVTWLKEMVLCWEIGVAINGVLIVAVVYEFYFVGL